MMNKRTWIDRLMYAYTRGEQKEEYYLKCPRCGAESGAEVKHQVRLHGETLHHWTFSCAGCGFEKNGAFSEFDEMKSALVVSALVIVFTGVIFLVWPDEIGRRPWIFIMAFVFVIIFLGGYLHMNILQWTIASRLKDNSHGR